MTKVGTYCHIVTKWRFYKYLYKIGTLKRYICVGLFRTAIEAYQSYLLFFRYLFKIGSPPALLYPIVVGPSITEGHFV